MKKKICLVILLFLIFFNIGMRLSPKGAVRLHCFFEFLTPKAFTCQIKKSKAYEDVYITTPVFIDKTSGNPMKFFLVKSFLGIYIAEDYGYA